MSKSVKFIIMFLLLFISPILWRIIFDEGQKLPIKSPSALEIIRKLRTKNP